MQSAEKAVTKAEQAIERRFEGVNEFGRTFRELTGCLFAEVRNTAFSIKD